MGPHPLGVFIAIGFLITLGGSLFWMLRVPKPLAQEVARAIYSVGSARSIIVPILDLFYTARAVELACRMGRQQGATVVLAYVVEVPRLLTLEAPLPSEVEERAQQALTHAQAIVERHGLKAFTTTVRAREGGEGVRHAVEAYQGDMVVMGVQVTDHRVPSVFTRTVETLLRQPPCEVIVDSVPA